MAMPPPFPSRPRNGGGPTAVGAAREAELLTEQMLEAATKAGVTKPLDDLAAEAGLDCTGAELLKYAQDIAELHGRPVTEIAQALRSDAELRHAVVGRIRPTTVPPAMVVPMSQSSYDSALDLESETFQSLMSHLPRAKASRSAPPTAKS